MKICILIQAHKNKKQLERLVNHLSKYFDIYLHIDKRKSMKFDESERVRVYKNFTVDHGSFNQIVLTIFLLKEAVKNNYDRYIFISAQDVPLKSSKYIIDFFTNNLDKEYISYEPITKEHSMFESLNQRLNNYNFGFIYRKIFNLKIRTFLSNIPLWKRTFPNNIYFGSNWWNITSNAVKYILDFIEKNKQYYKRFKYTWGGDEIFFQTILLNSVLKDKCINNCLRYLLWGNGTPINLIMKDYDEIKKSSAIFGIKFDDKIDNEIIDKLYREL